MLFCDRRGQCFAWLVNVTAVAVCSLLPYFWCSTVDSIQFHVACCTAVSCRCRYITDISLVHLLLWSVPNCLQPTHTEYLCYEWRCYSSSIYNTLLTIFLRQDRLYISILNSYIFLILAPKIPIFSVDSNNVKCYINIVGINTNYVFLSEYPNWTTDSTWWRESVHMWRV